jgi:hypothetical protein
MISHFYAPGTGIPFRLNTAQAGVTSNLTGNTGLSLVFTRPNGTTFTRAGTLSATDSNVIEYTIASGDFDPAVAGVYGDYTVYAVASFAGAPALPGGPVGFQVRQAGKYGY